MTPPTSGKDDPLSVTHPAFREVKREIIIYTRGRLLSSYNSKESEYNIIGEDNLGYL
jgi:hypothetical protein